ncbi:MAG: sigma-54 dependent transcriptional regulator [Desulfocapsaceae bacterium]|nr:sigma-54 dependent transcriptional regulator [Desulfocapsaceae bacterium]
MSTRVEKVFVVDDEESMRVSIAQWLSLSDYEVESFDQADAVLPHLSVDFDGVLVTDIRMPGMDGIELMEKALAIDYQIPVVFITAHGDIPMAVSAMRSGAYDFIEKPFEPEILLETIRRAGEKRRLILENRALKSKLDQSTGLEKKLLGNSEPIQFLHQEIQDLGPTDASVFLVGETGSGKEVVARCLHEISGRGKENFVAINCGAIPETLFESELFGHEPGAFTGAQGRRIGKFEKANGGTLFLDEVNAMPPNLQVKVLRVLQEREIERLGSNKAIPIDIRIISATNGDPRQACADGSFRQDLYYRLNVAEIKIPPLRQRGSDIILLFEYYCLQAAERYERDTPPLDNDNIRLMMTHNWPGNVRELKNAAERYILSSLPPQQRVRHILQHSSLEKQSEFFSLADQAANFERCVIEYSLKRHRGNVSAVLEELELPRRTLNQKMKNHGISRKNFLQENENNDL